MPVFVYRAADPRGQTIDGVMEAPDARSVVERLQRDACFPIQVVPQRERAGLAGLKWPGLRQRRVPGRELVAFTQQLATLLEAGLPLDRALGIQAELTPNPRLRTIAGDVLRTVRGGSLLGEALAKHHPRPFSRLYINMVRAGERGGVLEPALRRLAEFLESRAAFTDAIVSALAYPLVITTVGAGAVVFLLTFVIPRFATIFADLHQAIPLPTQILMAVSASVQSYWWVGVLAVLGGVFGWPLWAGAPGGPGPWGRPVP